MLNDILVQMIAVATCAIASFAIVLTLSQRKYPALSRYFALFLLAVCVNNLSIALTPVLEELRYQKLTEVLLLCGFASGLSLLPTFWIYVHALTSEAERRPPYMLAHLILPALGLGFAVFALIAPTPLRAVLFENQPLSVSNSALLYLAFLSLLELAFFPQLAMYLVFVIRRMLRYRKRLRDVYASTEGLELTWISGIGLFGFLFLATQIISLVYGLQELPGPLSDTVLSLPGFLAFLTAAFWGLRQRPALVPLTGTDLPPAPNMDNDPLEMPPVPAPAPPGTSPVPQAEKYEKSALSADAAARIERKLRSAMQQDQLYRDANLSLWALARHIGASPNNVSQTLNDRVGESFFDFVNGYRIVDAMRLLSESSDTVLAITYEVGFNSRSSFYTAFKRVTGQTPTGYRKTMSDREGSDDRTEGHG